MTRLRIAFATLAVTLGAIVAAPNSQAQTAATPAAGAPAAPGSELQEITVSASAISIAGYEAPTPVTAIGIQQLQSDARTDIGDVIRSMPAFANSPSPENDSYQGLFSAGIQGEDLANLRNLGIQRTLVLFDGQRVPQTNIQGGVDMSTIPASLIERVDSVTGGASATWGSDALAGVVNLIINKNYNGFGANLEYGNNDQSLHQQEKLELTAGTAFGGGAGHIEVAGSWWNVPDPYFVHNVPGWKSQRLVSNPACTNYVGETATCPAGQPTWLRADYVGLATASTGGVITQTGLTPGPSTALNNIGFGPGGTPYQFNPGNVSEGFFSNGGTPNYDKGFIAIDAAPLRNETAFLLTSWKFSDALTASLQLNYGTISTETNSYTADQYGSVPIYSGNPYIPASIQSVLNSGTVQGCPAGGAPGPASTCGFVMGTTNMNNYLGGGGSLGKQTETVSVPVAFVRRTVERGVFTLSGALGSKWSWDAYYMHGQSRMFENALNNADFPNLLNAENAVLVTPANVGTSGVPLGTIACASTLNPALANLGSTPGCQPLNIMGEGVASQGAINYITGPTRNGGDTQTMTLKEDVASAKVQGELPIGLSAGPIAAAAGLVYRREWGETVNCGFNCNNVLYNLGNFAAFGPASYNIKEGSAEINVPLLKDQGVQSLSFDAAARVSDYSTSGTVETYKFGVLSQVTNWVRVRGSYSRDIRAPNLFELFSSALPILGNIPDPNNPANTDAFFGTSIGNRSLQPEVGETKTAGLVFTPIQGMTFSIDWFNILIKGAINEGFGSSTIVAQCKAGDAAFCEQIIFGHYPGGCTGPTITSCQIAGGPTVPVAAILSPPVNSDRQTENGFDFNGDYRMPFGVGALDFSTAMSYITSEDYFSLGINCDIANGIGNDQGVYCAQSGVPKFRGVVSGTYNQGGWLGTISTRMIGAAHLVNFWKTGVDVSNNDIPFYWYFDLRLSYKWDNGLTLYGAIDNVADKIQPVIYNSPNSITIFDQPYRDEIYDGFGRVYRVGLRAKF